MARKPHSSGEEVTLPAAEEHTFVTRYVNTAKQLHCVSYNAVSFRISDMVTNTNTLMLRLDEATDNVEGITSCFLTVVLLSMEHDSKIFWVFMR